MSGLPRRTDTAIIGAGQAGLTMSWYLRQASREHVVLERRATLGGGWQDRWDRFRLVGPNWTASFPHAPYDGDDPDGFMTRDEIAGRVAAYASRIGAPVVLDAGVTRLRARDAGGFELETAQGSLEAREVIVAIGGFHVPHRPAIAGELSGDVNQLHAHAYRRETDLPPGGVLLVGSGQTGVQLAEELRDAGREVVLSVGTAGRAPRRYRGRDIFFWLWQIAEHGEAVGVELPRVERLPDPRRRIAGNVQLSGHHGGHDVDLRQMGRDGVRLVGRVVGADGVRVRFGDDLSASLGAIDHLFDERLRPPIDRLIEVMGMDAPPADDVQRTTFDPPVVEELDLAAAGIGTVIWTSGYRQDLSWIEPSVTDDMGFARQLRGVSAIPGLFFIGSLWQHDQLSATLFGLPRDARVLADRMGLTSP